MGHSLLYCTLKHLICHTVHTPLGADYAEVTESPGPVLVVLNKKVTTFGKKSNLKLGIIQTQQLH